MAFICVDANQTMLAEDSKEERISHEGRANDPRSGRFLASNDIAGAAPEKLHPSTRHARLLGSLWTTGASLQGGTYTSNDMFLEFNLEYESSRRTRIRS